MTELTKSDEELLKALQEGLPLCGQPYAELGARAGLSEDEVLRRIREWKDAGVIRKVGAFIAHRSAGIKANGMVVWDVPEDRLEEAGRRMAAHEMVSHCYARPRTARWPFRLYTMVHGRTREEVEAAVREIAAREKIENYKILFSMRELKKTETRMFTEEDR